MRDRVAQVVPKPPPGRYDGPLKINLSCDTANAEIYFTLDGSVPVSNSIREHGSRCIKYLPFQGYTFRYGGVYTLTVIAQKEKFVPTTPQVFVYHIDAAQFRRLKPSNKDLPIDDRFRSMQRLDPPMSIRVARRICPEMECCLKDTCPKELIQEKIRSGHPVTLFKLLYDDRNLTRNDRYQRIVAPCMNMTMPLFPTVDHGGPNETLIESSRRSFTPTVYAQPDSLLLPQLTGSNGSLIKLDDINGGGRASTAMNMNSSISSVYRGITNDTERRVIPSVCRSRKSFSGCAASTNCALAVFETKSKTWRSAQDSSDDKADRDEDAAYAAQCEEVVQLEIERVGRVSEKFSKAISRPLPLGGKADVAADSKDLLHGLLRAHQLARNRLLHKMLRAFSVADLSKRLSSDWINNTDLYNALDHAVSTQEIAAELSSIAVTNPPEPTKYSAKLLLAILRYMVCAARPIPEAVFALLVALSRNVAADRSEAFISKPALSAAIDHYRHTRGCHPHILEQLGLLFHTWLPWEKQGHLSTVAFLECIGDHMPMLDSALGTMEDLQLGVYHSTCNLDMCEHA
jgi:hypothetical protein